ncbi:MAG: hypothetical protein LUG99_14075 [Lachnospiraceae bacterium]|nr:hypothetical protein [Lachnospiraceae bacterium]
MKTFQESFEESYMAYEEPCSNKRGFRVRYAYVGMWYVYQLAKEELARYKRIFVLLCALGTASFAGAALWNCELNYRSFPILFSGLSLAAFLFQWLGVISFAAAGERNTDQSFRQMNTILRAAPLVNAILLLGAAVSCIVLIALNGYSVRMLAVPLLYLLSGACCFLITFFYRALPYSKQENRTSKDGSKKFIRT